MLPTLFLQNQFGEKSINQIIGGSGGIDCNFVVDSTNGNGLGIRSLKGNPYIKNIFMHTSATPLQGNPNPAVGYIVVQLNGAFGGYNGGYAGFVNPVSGTPINVTTGTTAGNAYIITSLGTTTLDQWQKLGLPVGVTPAVGACFIAIATTTATGTGVIMAPLAAGSGFSHIEVVGDANQTCNPSKGNNGTLVLVCLAATNSSTTTLAPKAPADGDVIGLRLVMLEQVGQPEN